MTIKQQGGIFGRNPSFNNVEIEDLTVSDANVSGTLTSNSLAVDTDTLYVDGASNRVGIGTASPSSSLHVETNSSTGFRFIGGTVGTNTIYMGDTDNNLSGYIQYSNTADYMRIATSGAERFRIHSDGDVELKTGNLIVPSGNGIDFSATSGTGTSELFDDYEEGTWTPTTAGDATGALTGAEAGTYTKVGRLVHVQFQFAVNTNFSSNLIGGLPYTPYIQSSISSLYGAVPVNTSSGSIYAVVQDTSTNILFYSNLSGTTHNPNTTSTFYRVALSYVTS